MLQLMLVVLNATKLANDFTQHIVLARTYRWQVTGDQVVYREYVRHLDVQRRFGSSIQIVELVNVELCLRRWDIDY